MKCPYCRFLLTKKEHHFDKSIYDFLKNDYLQTRNKAASIRNGAQRFGISTREAKEILDFIADEVYEEGNYRPSDEINDHGKYVRTMEPDYRTATPILIGILVAEILLLIVFLFQWAIASTGKVIAESGARHYKSSEFQVFSPAKH